MPPKGNAELLAGCARGETEAWDETVDRFGRLVWSVARSQRVSRTDAEDVRQLTWFRLMQNADRIRDPDRLGDWLATVARREAIKAATRDRRLVMIGDSETLEYLFDHHRGHHESPEQITLRADRGREVLRAIDSLSEQCREMLLRALDDPPASYGEIAAALSMPVGSVGPIRTRCLRRLRRALDQAAQTGETPSPGPDDCARCPARTGPAGPDDGTDPPVTSLTDIPRPAVASRGGIPLRVVPAGPDVTEVAR
ncbi:RNA polymerase sigma factor [Streptomyces sp. NPDC059582]|uniref:RNA polymerase sigma factor n=1 Tax=Streptomyces sp. NPDC059582 TaxID=3346875 RepID=UPI003687FAA2